MAGVRRQVVCAGTPSQQPTAAGARTVTRAAEASALPAPMVPSGCRACGDRRHCDRHLRREKEVDVRPHRGPRPRNDDLDCTGEGDHTGARARIAVDCSTHNGSGTDNADSTVDHESASPSPAAATNTATATAGARTSSAATDDCCGRAVRRTGEPDGVQPLRTGRPDLYARPVHVLVLQLHRQLQQRQGLHGPVQRRHLQHVRRPIRGLLHAQRRRQARLQRAVGR